MKYIDAINKHYAPSDLCRRILDLLAEADKDIDNLQLSGIATFEEFHTGGRKETLNLANLIFIDKQHRVLDIGCGIGGPARTLASEYDCHVIGIDLTREFVLAAQMLSEKVGLDDKTRFEQADACNLPFDNESFDIVWMQHVTTNVENKSALFAEICRVLEPDGRLAFHEYMRGNDEPLLYPVFWAAESSLNYLSTPDEYRQFMAQCAFKEIVWNNVTERAITFFEKVQRSNERGDKPPLGSHLILGDDAAVRVSNVLQNLESGAVTVVQAIFQK